MMELWPFTNFHDLNLDWIIKKIKNIETSEANAKASEEAAADSASDAAGSAGLALIYRNKAKDYRDEAGDYAEETADLLDSIAGPLQQIEINSARIDDLIATAGDGTIPSELTDIRVGYNGTTYTTAGDAVRSCDAHLNDIAFQAAKQTGYTENVAFSLANGTSHSSGKDKIYCNIPMGDEFTVGCTLTPAPPTNPIAQYWVVYSDGTSERIINDSANKYFNTKATKTIVNIGLFLTAPDADTTVNFFIDYNDKPNMAGRMSYVEQAAGFEKYITFKQNANNGHSSNVDRLSCNIPADHYFMINVSLASNEEVGMQVWALGEDNVDRRVLSGVFTGDTYTVNTDHDIKTIGITLAQVSTATEATVTVMFPGTIQESISQIASEGGRLPTYAQNMADSIISSLQTFQNSESVTFAMITDIHVNGPSIEDPTQKAFATSVTALNKISDRQPVDFAVLNGDYIYNDNNSTKAAMQAYYEMLASSTVKMKTPRFINKGNHDANDIALTTDNFLTDEELYQAFLKYTDMDYRGDYGYLEKAFGYYDIPNKKVRVIFVNTTDVPLVLNGNNIQYSQQHTTGISNEQLNFIANALKFDETGWGVVFISHQLLQNSAVMNPSNYSEDYLNPSHGGTQLMGVINAFRNGTVYSNTQTSTNFNYSVNVDYSDNPSNEVIAMFSGHNHADLTDVINGIRMISTTAASFIYTGYDENLTPYVRTPGTASETSWDIFTVDRMNHIIKASRYGAGSDRTFSY